MLFINWLMIMLSSFSRLCSGSSKYLAHKVGYADSATVRIS